LKRSAIFLLICVLILTGTGCSSDGGREYPWSITKNSMDNKNANADISIQLPDGSLTSAGTQLIVCNNSEFDISFGPEYSIQLSQNGSWYDIDVKNTDWTGELLTVDAGNECEVEINWASIYGELPVGKYRIVKEYSQLGQNFFAFAEFDIS